MNTLHDMINFFSEFLIPVMGVLGLCVGSFLNVCIHRGITGQSVVFPASHCPTCGAALSWWENIPVLSYVILRGKCGHCKTGISIQYPVVELLTAGWFSFAAYKMGMVPGLAVFIVVGSLFIYGSFVDLRTCMLPDTVTIGGAIVAVPGMIFLANADPVSVILGATLGSGVLLVLFLFYKYIRKIEALGTGDIILMIPIGAMVGLEGVMPQLLIAAASCFALSAIWIIKNKSTDRTMIPFGPFLSASGLGVATYKMEVVSVFFGIFA